MPVDLKDALAILGGLAAVVTIVGGLYKAWTVGMKEIFERIKFRLARAYWKIPRRTLVIVPGNERDFWWHMGGKGSQLAMQIVGDFYFTNISTEPAIVPKTYLVAYCFKWKVIPWSIRVEGLISIRHPDNDIYGEYEIPARFTTEGQAHWWISPPVKETGKHLRGKACFVDQYGNEHWTQVLTWRYQ